MTLGLVLSVIVGLLRGGSIGRLADFRFRRIWAVLAAFAVQCFLTFAQPLGVRLEPILLVPLYVLVYALLGYALLSNLDLPGAKALLIGAILNFLVISANGMAMPVSVSAMRWAGMDAQVATLQAGKAATHVVMGPGTLLWFLGDVMAIPRPFPRPTVFSLGDLFMLVGVFWIVQVAMLGRTGKPRRGAT